MIKKQIVQLNTMLTAPIILPELRVDSQVVFLTHEALLRNLTGLALEQLSSQRGWTTFSASLEFSH
jgi:hypothetical protein